MTAQTLSTPYSGTTALWSSWRISPRQILIWTLLFLGGVVMVLPFIFMVSTSLKFNNEIYELSLFPREPTLENYVFLFQETKFLRWFLNSLLIATATTVSVLFFDSFDMGYATAQTVILFLVLLFITLLQLWYLRQK